MTELTEEQVANIKIFIDNMVEEKKQDNKGQLTAAKFKEKVDAISESDKNGNNKIEGTEINTLIQSILATNPTGNAVFHELCERAATDDVIGKGSKQLLAYNAKKVADSVKFIKEIAAAAKNGTEVPEATLKSYSFMDLGTSNEDVRNHLDKANKEVALTMSEQIREILKNDKVLTEKAANLPTVVDLGTLDPEGFCVGVNHRGIGRST